MKKEMTTLNDYIAIYKEQLQKGDIQKAYTALIKYVSTLKVHLSKQVDRYSYGNVSLGYMDYTYFPFSDKSLRDKELRFGIVLNHNKLRFELWLMGRNAEIQMKYWEVLKTTKWNETQVAMPKYSVLEAVLVENPDFNNLDALTQNIEKEVILLSEEIINYLKKE